MSANLAVCQLAEQFASEGILQVAAILDVAVATATLVLLVTVARTPQIRSLPVHPNLKVRV